MTTVDVAFARSVPIRRDASEDETWLRAARCGEPWALERLYHEHQPAIYALCFRLLQRADDAEDAVQTTFVRAFEALPRFRGGCAARTWLYRIATNEALGMLRQRRAVAEEPEVAAESQSTPDAAPAVVESVAVHAALARLSPDHRAILVLRLWEELSYTEIAAVLKLSLPAVKMRLNRARAEFKREYEAPE